MNEDSGARIKLLGLRRSRPKSTFRSRTARPLGSSGFHGGVAKPFRCPTAASQGVGCRSMLVNRQLRLFRSSVTRHRSKVFFVFQCGRTAQRELAVYRVDCLFAVKVRMVSSLNRKALRGTVKSAEAVYPGSEKGGSTWHIFEIFEEPHPVLGGGLCAVY